MLTGGAGDDTFYFGQTADRDTITDFTAGGRKDRIAFDRDLGLTSFEQVRAAASQIGSTTDLTFSEGHQIVLQNVSLASLTAADFVFGT